ncbi:MAG: threonine ammonia-lyase [Terriglobales bacterium]
MLTLTPAELQATRARLAPYIVRTPVLHSRSLDVRCGTQVYLKCENFQRGGAFKYRGAMNRLLQLTTEERQRGVVAFSSGNHAQAVALASRNLGIEADLVMPEDAPRTKLAAVRDFGGRVHVYDRARQSREDLAGELVQNQGRVLVPPFDHPQVIAGQGTAALELLEEVPDMDALVVCIGGGGLISGCALAVHSVQPSLHVYGVEPATAADAKLSLERGQITPITDNPTIADGLRTVQPGALTFPVMQHHVRQVLTVTDLETIAALQLLLLRVKILAEPSGAVGVAALMSGSLSTYKKVGVVVSGGNVDPDALAAYLTTLVA